MTSALLRTLRACTAFVSTIAVGACGQTSPVPRLLVASAATKLNSNGDTILASLDVTNAGEAAEELSYGNCPASQSEAILVRAYRGVVSSTPAWNEDDANPAGVSCFLDGPGIGSVTLAPGETTHFAISAPVSYVLGDSLPSGEYIFTVSGLHLRPSVPQQITTGTLYLR